MICACCGKFAYMLCAPYKTIGRFPCATGALCGVCLDKMKKCGYSPKDRKEFLKMLPKLRKRRRIMEKYEIVNQKENQIVCKAKYGGRHYRQSIVFIQNGLIPVRTTKGRAERERDYLNEEYYEGWEIRKVEG